MHSTFGWLWLAIILLQCADARSAQKLNVLLIISDDLRDTVSCYGNTSVKTPHIDRLAARGVRFDRAYVQYPVCNPSRVSFLTGMRCEQTRVVDNTTYFRARMPDVVTLPQLLRQNGWHTAAFGKVFHTGNTKENVRLEWMDSDKSWDEAEYPQATSTSRMLAGRNLTGGKLKWCEWGAMDESDDDQPDGKTAALSSAAMERLNTSGKPWMIAAGFHRPHDPFLVPKKYFELYTSDSLQLHRDAPDATPLRPLSIGGGATQEAFNQFTDQDRLEFLRAYYAGVSFMDAQVGRLMETLDRLKLWDRTVVIFMGDHGYHLGERNWWNKSTLFERSCRTPLIVAAPGGTAGVCRGLVEMVDLYPTVTDYCALTTPDQFAGKSLRTLLRNPEAQARDAAFTLVVRGKNFGQTVRTDRWRFIQWSDRAVELYDHTNDPEEMHDQSTNPAHADEIEKLRELIKARVGGF